MSTLTSLLPPQLKLNKMNEKNALISMEKLFCWFNYP